MKTLLRLPFFDSLRTPAEVDAFFRNREGTCLEAIKGRLIAAKQKSRAGRTCYLVNPEEAYFGNIDKGGEFLGWGPK